MPAIRAAAIRALGALGGKNEAAVLVPLLGTPATEQDAAAAILCLHGPGVHEALLAEANKIPALRAKVFPLLVTRYALEAVGGLLAAAQDPDEQTRSAALDALGQLGGPELVADLARLRAASAPSEADRKKVEHTPGGAQRADRQGRQPVHCPCWPSWIRKARRKRPSCSRPWDVSAARRR